MKGKNVVITGATSGIGRATALELGRRGANLVLVGRKTGGGNRLVKTIQRDRLDGSVVFLKTDLSVLHEVRKLAESIVERFEHVDVLINNAGARFNRFQQSADGIELTFATNHLSHFMLTFLLQNALHSAPSARVVTVSSGSHFSASPVFESCFRPENYNRKTAYGISKLANVMFAYEFSRKMRGTRVTSNAMDPGGVATNLGRNNGWISWCRHLCYYAMKRQLISPGRAAETIVYLASSPRVQDVSGKYFYRMTEVRSSQASYDEETAARLWDLSLRLTGLGGQ